MKNNKRINKNIFNKKFSLITYLNKLNDFEREQEVIVYLNEFNKVETNTRWKIKVSTFKYTYLKNRQTSNCYCYEDCFLHY